MKKVGKGFYKVLEESLLELGQGIDLGIILARHPKHSAKLRPYLENVLQLRTHSKKDDLSVLDIEPRLSFSAALNDCISMMKRGEPIEVCYALYPEHEKQLVPWLSTFLELKKNGSLGTITNIKQQPAEDGPAPLPFSQALEDCLVEMSKGANPDDVLLRHPYYVERLRPWVYFQAKLDRQIGLMEKRTLPISQPSVQPKRKISRRRSFSYLPSAKSMIWTLLIAAYALFSVNGLVRAAAETLPGDSLYPVKMTYEAAQMFLANPDIKGELGEYFDAERRSETIALIESRRVESVVFIGELKLNILDDRRWFVSDVPVIFTNPGTQAEEIKDGTRVRIYGYTASNGVVVSAIEVLPPATVVTALIDITQVPSVSIQLPTATQMVAQPGVTVTPLFVMVVPSATDKPSVSSNLPLIFMPTDSPTATQVPTSVPTNVPTQTLVPTSVPTYTSVPTLEPTDEPTRTPVPTLEPTDEPTQTPVPTVEPTDEPTQVPTTEPTDIPTQTPAPTPVPTDEPFSFIPPLPAPTEIAVASGQ